MGLEEGPREIFSPGVTRECELERWMKEDWEAPKRVVDERFRLVPARWD